MNLPSFSTVYDGLDNEGNPIIIKATTDETKATIEAAANYFISQDEKLGNGIVTRGYFPKPIQYGNLFLTVQEKREDNGN